MANYPDNEALVSIEARINTLKDRRDRLPLSERMPLINSGEVDQYNSAINMLRREYLEKGGSIDRIDYVIDKDKWEAGKRKEAVEKAKPKNEWWRDFNPFKSRAEEFKEINERAKAKKKK